MTASTVSKKNRTSTTTSSSTDSKIIEQKDTNSVKDVLSEKLKQLTAVDEVLTEKAVLSLLKYHKSTADESKSLLGTDVPIRVQFTLERTSGESVMKPVPIKIPYPLHKIFAGSDGNDMDIDSGTEEPDVCLIVKDDETKTMVQELITDFPQHMTCIKKVLTLQSLRTKHKEFKQRRDLLHKYTLFLADDRILPMLTKALGTSFVKAKKLPIPVSIARKSSLPFAIHKALSSTFLTIAAGGNCVSILAGNTGMPVPHLVANILSITSNAVPKIPKKWSNVRSIAIKLPSSMELPIYNKTPEQLLEISEMAGLKPNYKVMDDAENKNNEKSTEVNDEEEKVRKRKLEEDKKKSPLLRAIKKQKELEPKKDVSDKVTPEPSAKKLKIEKSKVEESSKNDKSKPKKNSEGKESKSLKEPVSSSDKNKNKVTEKKGDVSSTDKESGKKNSSKPKEIETREPKDSNAGKQLETPKSSKKVDDDKSKKNEKPESAMKSSSKKDKEPSSKKDKEQSSSKKGKESKDAETPSKENGPFIPSKKFTGSKKGYVFKKDKQGVGYYLDQRPVVDPMIIDAIMRMGSNKGNSGSDMKRNKSGGRQSFGGSGGHHGGHKKQNNRRKSR